MAKETLPIEAFLHTLKRSDGGYADDQDKGSGLRVTLSVIKALGELGQTELPALVTDYVLSCWQGEGFANQPNAAPTAFDTAVGLITLKSFGLEQQLEQYHATAVAFMQQHAQTQYDYFMLIAAYDECGFSEPVPEAAINFFQQHSESGLVQGSIQDSAIATAALLRANQQASVDTAVTHYLIDGQNSTDGGFGEAGEESTLFTSYCVMRTLTLLNQLPNIRLYQRYLNSLKTSDGYALAPGQNTSAGATYQVLSMQGWIAQLQSKAVDAARAGDIEWLTQWLQQGGDPNCYDTHGWTPLLGASAHGQSDAVELLLNNSIDEGTQADINMRMLEADALPIYMAGQSGDLKTVQVLLKAAPEHVYAISKVNGHTVLLQAAFYGKWKHQQLAKYLLDNIEAIDPQPGVSLQEQQTQLLTATNVRGYSALTMQELWHNQEMIDLLQAYYPQDPTSEHAEALHKQQQDYYEQLLLKIASPQELTEQLLDALTSYINETGDISAKAFNQIEDILIQPQLEIDRLGGALMQPALVFAITGVNQDEEQAQRRYQAVQLLLDNKADPCVRELHPMAIGAVIRASVLNHFDLLKLLAEYMSADSFTREMNTSPAVNGLTAMHDAVHRALTSPPENLDNHINQIHWMVEHGARLDIPDHTGQTQRQLALDAKKDPATFPPQNVKAVLQAIGAA